VKTDENDNWVATTAAAQASVSLSRSPSARRFRDRRHPRPRQHRAGEPGVSTPVASPSSDLRTPVNSPALRARHPAPRCAHPLRGKPIPLRGGPCARARPLGSAYSPSAVGNLGTTGTAEPQTLQELQRPRP
jgi:hypothetical protein